MARLIFTDAAKQDLLDIRRFTQEKWGVAQAKTYISALRDVLRTLLERPLIGSDRSDDLGAGVFSFPQASHMIYYTQSDDDLVVLAVLHQSMVPARHINQR